MEDVVFTSAVPVKTGPLSSDERDRLSELEYEIARGFQTFRSVGRALAEVNESRLYRDEYRTFEAYCKGRWGWGKTYAYDLIKAHEMASIADRYDVILDTEHQARQLGKVPREHLDDAIKDIGQRLLSGRPSSKVVTEVVKEYAPQVSTEIENCPQLRTKKDMPEPAKSDDPKRPVHSELRDKLMCRLAEINATIAGILSDIKGTPWDRVTVAELNQLTAGLRGLLKNLTPHRRCGGCGGTGCHWCQHTGDLTKTSIAAVKNAIASTHVGEDPELDRLRAQFGTEK